VALLTLRMEIYFFLISILSICVNDCVVILMSEIGSAATKCVYIFCHCARISAPIAKQYELTLERESEYAKHTSSKRTKRDREQIVLGHNYSIIGTFII
jgi:hypothetical protein